MKILVTGATGFIGSHLLEELEQQGYNFIGTSLRKEGRKCVKISLEKDTDWSQILKNIDCVIHLAGLAHGNYSDNKFNEINFEGSSKLVKQCVKNNVKKFIYLSSVSVMGNYKNRYSLKDIPRPSSSYGVSKLKSENIIQDLCKSSQMNYIIIRPPLVYGKNAPGNFGNLVKFINNFYVIPFGSLINPISILSISNLISFIIFCINEKKTDNRVFIISDKKELTVKDIIKKIAESIEKKRIILSVNIKILYLVSFIIGFNEKLDTIFKTKVYDSYDTYKDLHWRPNISFDEEMKK